MNEEIRQKADELYKRGLLIFAQPLNKERLALLNQIWEQALKLYGQIGDADKVHSIESALVKLYKQISHYDSIDAIKLPPSDSDFKDWDTFFKIGCYGFGGPMAVFSLLHEDLVGRKKILTNQDFLEGAVLGDILPGPVTMDIVTYAGYKLKKWTGAFISTLVFILPSFILMLLIAVFYDKFTMIPRIENMFKCLSAVVTGLIISVGMKLGESEIKEYYSVGIFIWAFVSSLIFKMDIILVVGLAGLAGILLYTPPWKNKTRNPPDSPLSKGDIRGIKKEI